ncbi:MAG: hypothetical protein ABFD89_18420 [Bryobacteraceae bacterium]
MVDISITAANVVVSGTGHSRTSGTAGETIPAGKAYYVDPTTKKWMLADSNSTTAEARHADGVTLNSASLNQPINGVKSGAVTIGGTLTAGVAYYLSDTPGGICPVADIGTGEYVCLLGIALSATVLDVDIHYSGVAL